MPPHHHHDRHGPLEHPHHHPHHRDEPLLSALESILAARKVRTTEELAEFADLLHEPEVAEFLRSHAHRRPDLALAALRVKLELDADDRLAKLIDRCALTSAGLVLPLPRHILELFDSLRNRTLLVNGRHGLPHHVRGSGLSLVEGSHACRAVLNEFQALVFEAHQNNGALAVAAEVAEIIDVRIIPTDTLFVVHLRAHEHFDDIALPTSTHELVVL